MIGENIKTLRESYSLTQTELAGTLGIAQAHLCNIENGKRTPSLKLLLSICKVLNSEINEIVK